MPSYGSDRIAVYGVLVVIGALGAISDALLNQWARTGRLSWLLAAYVSWLTVATLLGFVLRWGYFSFGAAVVLFLLVNTVAALALDYLLFSGRVTAWGWIGIGLAVAAIACMELGRVHQLQAR
jgi:drug/metabolite transporter (DMT)-like permease